MWAQQDRFRGNFARFVEIAHDAGFDAIEVSHSTDEAGLRECLACRVLPVASLHAPTPYAATARGKANSALNLAGLDDAERQEAVAATRRTIDVAAEAGVPWVVVHLGEIEQGPREQEARLYAAFAAGDIDGDEARRARRDAVVVRAAAAPAHIEAARRSLAELVAYASRRSVVLGLENRLRYFEIPTADEALDLLSGYSPSQAGYWHDSGHAEVWARLGLLPHGRWFELLGDRLIGCHLHDVEGLRDHRAPGNGTLDWGMVLSGIPSRAVWTCEIDQHEPEELLDKSVRLLRGAHP